MSTQLTAAQIRTALLTQSFTMSDLTGINDSLRLAYKRAQNSIACEFNPGDRVTFTARGGRLIEGKVIRRNTKTIQVFSDDNVNWKVSPSLLRKI